MHNRKRRSSVKELAVREVVRSCRVCSTVFTQKLINSECLFCGARQNKMEKKARVKKVGTWIPDAAEQWLRKHG